MREALIYLFDIYPTLCEVAAVPVDETVEGRSFLALTKGVGPPTRESLFTVYQHSQLAVRDGRWKLIRFPKIDVTLLFDLKADPLETHDLAADTEHASTLDRMQALLLGHQSEFADKTPWVAKELGPKQVDLSGRTRKPDRHQPEWIKKKYF